MTKVKVLLLAFFALMLAAPIACADTNTVIQSASELSRAMSEQRFGTRFDLHGTVLVNGRVPYSTLSLLVDGEIVTAFDHSGQDLRTIRPGDRVRLLGTVNPGKTHVVAADFDRLEFVAHGAVPVPPLTTVKDLQKGSAKRRLIRLQGTIVDASPDEIDADWYYFILRDGTGSIFLTSRSHGQKYDLASLIGSTADAVGIYNKTIGKRQMLGMSILLDSLESLQILEKSRSIALNIENIDDISYFSNDGKTARIHHTACGTVLATWERNRILLRTDSGRLVRGELSSGILPKCGDVIRMTGFPETDLYNVILVRASWTKVSESHELETAAQVVSPEQILSVKLGAPRYDFNFHGQPVRMTGTVRGMPVRDGLGVLHLECGGHLVQVDISSLAGAIRNLDVGFKVEVTGVCVIETEKMSLNRVFPRITEYRIVVRTPKDIRILAHPSWWTPQRTLVILGLLLTMIFVILVWNLALRRIVSRRSHELEAEITARVASESKVRERTRLAVELHDSIAQNLTGATMQLRAAGYSARGDTGAMLRFLAMTEKTLDSCRKDLRNCIWDLRNKTLEEKSLDEAIRQTIAQHASPEQLTIRFNVPRERLSDNAAHTVLTIVRELAINAVRHGEATEIRIAGCLDGNRLVFSVSDNGRGFNPEQAPGMSQGHFGLQGIRDRVKAFDGSETLSSAPGKGCKVTVELYLEQNHEKA